MKFKILCFSVGFRFIPFLFALWSVFWGKKGMERVKWSGVPETVEMAEKGVYGLLRGRNK